MRRTDEDTPQTSELQTSEDYDPTTALLVVDVQNDFADARGSLYVAGGEEVVAEVNARIVAARAAGALVVFTQDWHPPSTPHFDVDGGDWPVHCVQETWGAQLHPRLELPAEAPVVRKGVDGSDGYSGFSVRDHRSGERADTVLGELLRDTGIERIVVTGLAGDVCVAATAHDGVRLGFEVVVPLAATRMVGRDPEVTARTVAGLRDAGVVVEPA